MPSCHRRHHPPISTSNARYTRRKPFWALGRTKSGECVSRLDRFPSMPRFLPPVTYKALKTISAPSTPDPRDNDTNKSNPSTATFIIKVSVSQVRIVFSGNLSSSIWPPLYLDSDSLRYLSCRLFLSALTYLPVCRLSIAPLAPFDCIPPSLHPSLKGWREVGISGGGGETEREHSTSSIILSVPQN